MDFGIFDADQHYYEAEDCLSRYASKRMQATKAVRWLTEGDGKRRRLAIADRITTVIGNPTFDPIVKPGAFHETLKSLQAGEDRTTTAAAYGELVPIDPCYRDRDVRLKRMDEQGVERALLFPTLGVTLEGYADHDPELLYDLMHAFNRWLEDDWGYSYRDRLIAVPMLSFADPDAAVEEVERLIERGARIVHVRPAPVPGPNGTGRSLGDKAHDPVWARLAEASIPVAFHLGDSGYNRFAASWGGSGTFEGFGKTDVLSKILVSDRAIHDTIASLVIHGVFKRHPTLRVASIENGSDWMHVLVKRLRKQANQTPWVFPEDPGDTVRAHVWVTPYCEEDFQALAELIGVERILFGSDWPHGEGLAQPMDFEKELSGFGEDDVRRIMRDNCVELLGGKAA